MIELDTLGYNLFPKLWPESPGVPRVDFVFRAEPTGVHFDPEKMRIPVATPAGDIRLETIRHPWHRDTRDLQVVAGRIILEDRFEKRVEFFTLGGKLSILSEEACTVAELTSPAPIIELSLVGSVPERLAEEIDAMLAKRRAFWEGHPYAFEQRLIAANPLVLYAACLVTFHASFERFPYHAVDDLTDFIHFLGQEIAALQNSVGKDLSRLSIEQII